MYNQKVIEIFKNPKNVGALRGASCKGIAGTVNCGDVIEIYLKIEDDVVTDAKFKAFGGADSIASASVATELVKNKTLDEAQDIDSTQILNALGGLPAENVQSAVFAEQAIGSAILDFKKKQERLLKKQLQMIKK